MKRCALRLWGSTEAGGAHGPNQKYPSLRNCRSSVFRATSLSLATVGLEVKTFSDAPVGAEFGSKVTKRPTCRVSGPYRHPPGVISRLVKLEFC